MTSSTDTKPTPARRVQVFVDTALARSLQEHQRKLAQDTGVSVSLSQAAASILRHGLKESGVA